MNLGLNIGQWPWKFAERERNSECVKFGNLSWTWESFNKRINKTAHALQQAGVHKGDRVAVLLANGNVLLEVLYAVSKIGAIMVPLNYRLAAPELEFIIKDSGPEMMFYSPEFKNLAGVLKNTCPSLKNYVCEMSGGLERDHEYEVWTDAMPDSEPIPDSEVLMEDPVIIMYTSGTTGRPKGALLKHRNMIFASINAQHYFANRKTSISLCSAPLFHIGALNVSVMPFHYVGGKVIIQRNFDASEAIGLIRKEKVTNMFGVPTMFQFMMTVPEWETADFSSIEYLTSGGAPCSREIIEAYQAKGALFTQGWGMTETTGSGSSLPPKYAVSKMASCGFASHFMFIKIVDSEEREVSRGEVGELLVKGPFVIDEYWNLPEETKKSIRDGWLSTGDMCYQDEEGLIYITDRKKDMYISGGENVYPAEVENILNRFAPIAEVAVIGIPDSKWGETGMAIVVPRPDRKFSEEDFFAFCRQNLASYKRPAKLVITDKALPRTATGKLIKKELKSTYRI